MKLLIDRIGKQISKLEETKNDLMIGKEKNKYQKVQTKTFQYDTKQSSRLK